MTSCVGLFAGQKWCISGNHGNTLSDHHLSVRNPSVCSQGMPCQVLWSGMLGLGRGGQRQLILSTAMDSNFSACPHQTSKLGSRTCHWQLLQVIIYKSSRTNRLPKPCTLCSSHRIELFPAKIERFPGPSLPPPGPPHNAPTIMSNHRCGWGKPRGHFLRTPFWQGNPSPAFWAPPGTNWVCRVAQLGPAWGPAYSEVGGSFGAGTLTGMAGLTVF